MAGSGSLFGVMRSGGGPQAMRGLLVGRRLWCWEQGGGCRVEFGGAEA